MTNIFYIETLFPKFLISAPQIFEQKPRVFWQREKRFPQTTT